MIDIKSFEYNPFQENTYLLINEKKECIIVDPGCYFAEERENFLKYLKQHELKPVRLLNTHCHLDHIFGNKLVYKTFGLKPEIHAQEQIVLDQSPMAGAMYNVPFEPSPEAGGYLKAGEKISFGEDELDILFTPGHSPGSVSFYCPAQDFVISGDVLFKGSIGRTDLPGGDYDTLITAIKEQLFPLGDNVKVYPGHGPSTTIGEEKHSNPFLNQA